MNNNKPYFILNKDFTFQFAGYFNSDLAAQFHQPANTTVVSADVLYKLIDQAKTALNDIPLPESVE